MPIRSSVLLTINHLYDEGNVTSQAPLGFHPPAPAATAPRRRAHAGRPAASGSLGPRAVACPCGKRAPILRGLRREYLLRSHRKNPWLLLALNSSVRDRIPSAEVAILWTTTKKEAQMRSVLLALVLMLSACSDSSE